MKALEAHIRSGISSIFSVKALRKELAELELNGGPFHAFNTPFSLEEQEESLEEGGDTGEPGLNAGELGLDAAPVGSSLMICPGISLGICRYDMRL